MAELDEQLVCHGKPGLVRIPLEFHLVDIEYLGLVLSSIIGDLVDTARLRSIRNERMVHMTVKKST